MATLEQWINAVRNSSNASNLCEVAAWLKKNNDILLKNPTHLDQVLNHLKLPDHTLGVLSVLDARLSLPNVPDFEGVLSHTDEFLRDCDTIQVRHGHELYSEYFHRLTYEIVERKLFLRGVTTLLRAVQKLQGNAEELTSIHADLCQLCLSACHPAAALPVLEADISQMSPDMSLPDASEHFLRFYYYGGSIYCALKEFDKAHFFFEQAVVCPASVVSKIALESYKKLLIVSLLITGKTPQIPKYVSQGIVRHLRGLSQPYHDLASVFVGNDPTQMERVIRQHEDTFRREQNLGLVKQCIPAFFKKNIRRLTNTFVTLSLADVTNRANLNSIRDAESYVLEMIAARDIYATINEKDGMVSFHDNPVAYNSQTTLEEVDSEIRKCMFLDEKIQRMDQEISLNPQYLQKVAGSQEDKEATSLRS